MQKKRKIYLIAMIIVTLLLVADLAVFALSRPKAASFASFGSNTENSQEVSSSSDEQRQQGGPMGGAKGEGAPARPDAEDADGEEENSDQKSDSAKEDQKSDAADASDDENASGQMSRPDGEDMPEGMEMPDGEDMPEGMEMPDGENMSEGMEMPGANSAPWRIACIPIAIILGIADILLLIFFLRAKKKENVNAETEDEETYELEDPVEARLRKTRRNRIVIAIFLVVLLIIVIVLNKLSSGAADSSGMNVDEEVMETAAEKGDISQALQGSGVVASLEEEDVTVPGDIQVTKYYVEDGDKVSEGDKIAAVDKNSVLAAMGQIEELMEEIDEDMTEVKDSAGDQDIEASNDATVVAIFAEEDESVVDVMYDHGALMLLSLDGCLSVDIDYKGDLGVGDTVTVTDGDGNSADGEIVDVRKKAITVTVDADDFDYDTEVKVTSGDTSLGKGTLGVYNGQKITGYAGTVDDIDVSVGSVVDAGDTLMTITDLDYEAAYETLLADREELEEQYSSLVEIASSGYVYAKADGVISDLNEDIKTSKTSSKTASSDAVKADTTAAKAGVNEKEPVSTSGKVVADDSAAVKKEANTAATSASTQQASGNAGRNQASCANVTVCTLRQTSMAGNTYSRNSGTAAAQAVLASESDAALEEVNMASETEAASNMTENTASGDVSGSSSAAGNTSGESTSGGSSTTESGTTDASGGTSAEDTGGSESQTTSYNIVVVLDTANSTTDLPTEIELELKVGDDKKRDNIKLSEDANKEWKNSWTGLEALADGQQYDIKPVNYDTTKYTYEWGTSETTTTDGTTTVTMHLLWKLAADSSGDMPSGQDKDAPSGQDQSQSQAMPGNMAGAMISGMSDSAAMAGVSGMSAGLVTGEEALAAETEEEENQYLLDETSLCALTADDQVTVNITIDELDILQIKEGQECTVTFDALEGQSFTGEIQKRNVASENSGGNTKYTVTVILDKSEDLLLGMNANVSITVEEKSDVVMIPESALQEEEGSVFVYTGYDEKKDEMTDPVEVSTGLSDGTNVEILEGLEEGQQIYYKYADSISYTFAQ